MWQTRKHKDRNETNGIGMSGIKWKDKGDFWSDNYTELSTQETKTAIKESYTYT